MSKFNQQQCFEVLQQTIGEQPIDWRSISAAVQSKMVVKNWMHVRGVLQYMLNERIIARTDSVEVEQYYKVGVD